jgi:bacterioferritin
MLAKAAAMEEQSAKDYNAAANECSANSDSVSKQIFEQLVQDEERHFDMFDKQAENIKKFGLSYLALQSFTQAAEPGPQAGA